jgi:hypothetical protein
VADLAVSAAALHVADAVEVHVADELEAAGLDLVDGLSSDPAPAVATLDGGHAASRRALRRPVTAHPSQIQMIEGPPTIGSVPK